jgi:hypothetical protein
MEGLFRLEFGTIGCHIDLGIAAKHRDRDGLADVHVERSMIAVCVFRGIF